MSSSREVPLLLEGGKSRLAHNEKCSSREVALLREGGKSRQHHHGKTVARGRRLSRALMGRISKRKQRDPVINRVPTWVGVCYGPKGRSQDPREASLWKPVWNPKDAYAPDYETCLKSRVSEGNKREIKALTNNNWVKRVIKGVKPNRSPVWTSIHNDWKRPSYSGIPLSLIHI